eukprot:2330490-Amphidinium_carterae.1
MIPLSFDSIKHTQCNLQTSNTQQPREKILWHLCLVSQERLNGRACRLFQGVDTPSAGSGLRLSADSPECFSGSVGEFMI